MPTAVEEIDVSNPDIWAERVPYDLFATLRAEDPVHWSEMTAYEDEPGFWSITKASHLTEISKDYESFSSERGGVFIVDGAAPVELQRHQFISMDPPAHTRLKEVFQRVFTPKMIATQESMVRGVVRGVLESVAEQGRADLVEDVGGPVVARVIGSLLGTPPEVDGDLIRWGRVVLGSDDIELRPDPRPEFVYETLNEMLEYVLPEIRERMASPGGDLLSRLAAAEVEGDPLSELEIGTVFALLLSAGTDSTKAVYTSGMKALIEHPDQMALLARESDLIPEAVEEMLRCFPAFAHFRRTVTRDIAFHGAEMKEGDKVALWYVSGNRDEEVYDEPERFDVTRNPRHQAFGAGGRHFCLGAALARLELRVLIEETLAMLERIELDGEPRRARSNILNQYKSLPVRFEPSER